MLVVMALPEPSVTARAIAAARSAARICETSPNNNGDPSRGRHWTQSRDAKSEFSSREYLNVRRCRKDFPADSAVAQNRHKDFLHGHKFAFAKLRWLHEISPFKLV